MKTKHLVAAGVASIALGSAAILPFAVVSADEATSTTETTFVQKLAEKLGISVETVQTAVESTREEIKSQREAEREAALSEAVTAGTITQRQADILNSIDDAMQSIRESMSPEERQSQRQANTDLSHEERRAQMEVDLVSKLNEAGLNTSVDEVTAARDAAKNANVLPIGEGRGGRGKMGL